MSLGAYYGQSEGLLEGDSLPVKNEQAIRSSEPLVSVLIYPDTIYIMA